MYIAQYFKYEKDNVIGVGMNVPEGATILETMDILYADNNKDLVRISDDKNVGSSIWLKNGDVKENYKEVEHEEKPFKKEIDNADN